LIDTNISEIHKILKDNSRKSESQNPQNESSFHVKSIEPKQSI